MRVTQGGNRLGPEAEGVGETVGKSPYCGFHRKEQVRQGSGFRIGGFE